MAQRDEMDYEAWAEWYDVVHTMANPDEVRFYVELAAEAIGPVLEIGVGTGRIALPAAEAGALVVGVDFHEPMLARARAKMEAQGSVRGAVELVQADMRNFDLGCTFNLVIIPGRTLLLLGSSREQRRVLRLSARHVAPGGRLVLDVFNPTPELLADSESEPFLIGQCVNPATGLRCRLWARNQFDTIRQKNRSTQIVEELAPDGSVARTVKLQVVVRYLYPSELHAALSAAGLRVVESFGDFNGSPLSEESRDMVFIAEKAV